MNVVECLGPTDLEDGIQRAREEWSEWVREEPALALVPGGFDRLARWRRYAAPPHVDAVMRALVRLGSVSGGNRPAAVWVVIWLLLPGARRIARSGDPEVTATVATQLWIEVATFPWDRRRRVVGNVLAATRAAVARRGQLTALELATQHTVPAPPHSDFFDVPEDETDPVVDAELQQVLAWARSLGVIDDTDIAVLLALLSAVERLPGGRAISRSAGGLMSEAALRDAADHLGVSPATVKRRVRRSLDALTAACRDGGYEAA